MVLKMKKLVLILIVLCLSGCNGNAPASSVAETATPEPSQSVEVAASKPTTVEATTQATAVTPKKAGNKQTADKPAQAEVTQTAQPIQTENTQTVQLKIVGETELLNIAIEPKEGESVFDLLKRVTKEQGIQMKSKGFGGFAYVESIANLREFDQGPSSGWTYYVNGEYQQVGAGQVKVKVGDVIEWKYTK